MLSDIEAKNPIRASLAKCFVKKKNLLSVPLLTNKLVATESHQAGCLSDTLSPRSTLKSRDVIYLQHEKYVIDKNKSYGIHIVAEGQVVTMNTTGL